MTRGYERSTLKDVVLWGGGGAAAGGTALWLFVSMLDSTHSVAAHNIEHFAVAAGALGGFYGGVRLGDLGDFFDVPGRIEDRRQRRGQK